MARSIVTEAVALEGSAPQRWSEPRLAHVGGFTALEEECDYRIGTAEIRGRVPASVRGTFFRIGPGRNSLGGQKFGHWFDGDGMLHALTFTDDGAWYRNRYVRTPKYVRETAAQQVRCRSFGHNAPGGWLKNIGRPPANCANTSMVWHGERLLALWEGGRPWEMDPVSLATVGECDYGGRLRAWEPFSAHGSVHPNGCYYNHGVSMGLTGPRINLYEVSPAGRLQRKSHFRIDRLAFVHDAGMSARYKVFLVHPLGLGNPLPFMLGMKAFDECVEFRPEWGMKAYVVSLETLAVERVFELPPFAVFHLGNCRERGDELVLELVRFEDYAVAEALRNVFTCDASQGGQPWRLRLNLRTGQVAGQPLPMAASCEFPQWDLRYSTGETRYLYSAAIADNGTPGFFNAIQRLDTETGAVTLHDLGPGRFTSEAVFVAEGQAEGDGYLCAVVYDARSHHSEVLLLDARSAALEEVAAVPLRNHVPFGFHCGYTSRAFLPA
ncbi:lignostilbene-alpha,beta-dioxygenase [Alcanivorax sp. S71-1-4]|uniref:carotenoid oxygenase family protein n=1 Tax=Alcanivorax sp. S71-1-4 TaxID=1177159 RepID=UPI001358EC55|nr:carotenoid oxygenase family protein [Alcanivorax sp. S71-1-4]KAF0804742.1 lignostilbene-alpha,beta-dioxygenase [Alcanivorax sp. S71-1-4]